MMMIMIRHTCPIISGYTCPRPPLGEDEDRVEDADEEEQAAAAAGVLAHDELASRAKGSEYRSMRSPV